MVRPPCCEGKNLKKGPWTPEEDEKLVEYVGKHGHSNWKAIPKLTGLNRCGKSCRLRWTNYLRPDIKRGKFSDDEERLIVNLHSVLGNKWSRIATHLPGRTDNEIKNYWNTHIRKKLLQMGVDPITHKPRNDPNQQLLNLVQLLGGAAAQPATNNNFSNNYNNPLDSILLMKLLQPVDAAQLMKMELLQNLLLAMNTATSLPTNNHYTNMPNLMPQNIPNPLVDAPPQDLISNNHLHPENSDGARNGYSEAYDQIMAGYGGGLNINESRKDNTNKLPELVSASVSPADSSYGGLLESKSNSLTCDVDSPTSAIFEDWEKLLDEESFDAYWKEFLE